MTDGPTVRIPLRTCIRCGKPVVAGMKECFSCGAPVDEEKTSDDQLMRCPTCGKELMRGAIMCSLCGTRLQPERSVASVSSPASPSRTTPIPLTTLESSPELSSPPPSLEKSPFLDIPRRMGLRLGTLACLLIGFLGGKVLFRNLPAEIPHEEHSMLHEELPILHSATERIGFAPPAALLSETLPKPVLPKGRVITADDLTNIRIFGSGAIDPKRATPVLRKRIEEFLPSIRSVYSEKLTATQHLLGTIVLELVVTEEGRVSQIDTHTTGLENPEFLQLVRSLVQEWQFESIAAGTTTVFYPLLFMPTDLDPYSFINLTKELMPGRYRMVGGEPTAVYLRPTAEVQEIGRVSPGLRIDVVGSQNGWLTVLSPKGRVGYVRHEAILSRVGDDQPAS